MSDEKRTEDLYAAVLLPEVHGRLSVQKWRRGLPNEGITDFDVHHPDKSPFPFLIEELVSQGAIHLAIDANSPYFDLIVMVPEVLRARIWKIDKQDRCTDQIRGVMAPILRETGITLDGPLTTSGPVMSQCGHAVSLLCIRDLRPFLLGLEYQLQIEIDLQGIRSRLAVLDGCLSSSESRAHLSMLRLIFGAYETRKVNELQLSPASPAQAVEAFERFVADSTYKELSTQSRLIGFPLLNDRAITQLDRLTNLLVTNSPLRHLVALGTKAIEIATKIPMPDSKALESLMVEEYLPPIVSLDSVREKALSKVQVRSGSDGE